MPIQKKPNEAEQVQARQHTYTLFSQLYLQGIPADLLPYLQSIPDLAGALPDPFDPDETAAAHQTLFGFNIFPNASIFLHPSRLLGGLIANRHADLYRQNNFVPDSAVDPDHISQSLAFLAYLSQEETSKLASGQSSTIPRSQQYYFLESHLLPWIIPFTIAVHQQDNSFYNSLAQLSLALVADHYVTPEIFHFVALNQTPKEPPKQPQTPSLEDGRTGLREIARFLVTPVLSGLYLGRSDINRLARRLNLPHGFGRRDQMLQTLFQSAGQYESAPQLFAALNDLLGTWKQAYQQVARDYPKITHHISPWQARLHQAQTLLSQMEQQLDLSLR